jgi:RNA polymerase sigma factor (sigma-70 family)
MEEAQLIELARSGDRDAFAQLLQRYEKPVYHQALRMVGSTEDAADMTQDAFIKAWQGLPNFQGGSSFSTWLYRITDNVCIDFLRRDFHRVHHMTRYNPTNPYLLSTFSKPYRMQFSISLHRKCFDWLTIWLKWLEPLNQGRNTMCFLEELVKTGKFCYF